MKRITLAFALPLLAMLSLAYGQTTFERGDLVRLKSKSPDFSLKVVAIPGDKVTIDKSGVTVNGEAVPHSRPDLAPDQTVDIRSMLIPDGHYYVMGERRTITEAGEDVSQHAGLHPGTELEKAAK